MSRFARLVVAVVTAFGLLTIGPPAPASPPERAGGSLKVSPSNYIAGQKMTFTGSLGRRGSKPIGLQFHMNRPGDVWTKVEGFRSRTDRAGKFRFTYPSPAMWGISMRVVSGRVATPAHTFHAKSQEVMLSAGNDNRVVAGVPFAVTVDTTPSQAGRADLPPPAIPGRTVTLQRRVNTDRWETIGTAVTDGAGFASFTRTEAAAGVVVYRARQEDWTRNGNRIGWFPSFPTYVAVTDGAAPRSASPSGTRPRSARCRSEQRVGRPTPASATAGVHPCSTLPGSTASP